MPTMEKRRRHPNLTRHFDFQTAPQLLSRSSASSSPLEHLRSPEIVQMEDALELQVVIHDD